MKLQYRQVARLSVPLIGSQPCPEGSNWAGVPRASQPAMRTLCDGASHSRSDRRGPESPPFLALTARRIESQIMPMQKSPCRRKTAGGSIYTRQLPAIRGMSGEFRRGDRSSMPPPWRCAEAAARRALLLVLSCLVGWLGSFAWGHAASVSENSGVSAAGGSPYSQWSNGPSPSADFFPIGVWLQIPSHIAEFKRIGINMFAGFWGDLDQTSLEMFARGRMPLIPAQNSVGLTTPQNRAIVGWSQPDEPDNAQHKGIFTYRSCQTPSQIVSSYDAIKAQDTTRPVLLGFGRGVSDTTWTGRGSCTGQTTGYYPLAVAGGDIISFDVYPVAAYGGRLEMVANGLDNLKTWIAMSGTGKIVWNTIEAVPISSGAVPTLSQERAEVWMSLIHGSQGIIYFVHQFDADGPKLIREDGIFNFAALANAVASINARIAALAPVLNSPTITGGVSVVNPGTTPISTMVKRYNGSTYVFAVAMLNNAGTATFTLPDIHTGTVEVLDESRGLSLSGGVFEDDFTGYGVHLYQVNAK
jgi:hypothetical protein